jgi:outer membrane protein assembly factor BamB
VNRFRFLAACWSIVLIGGGGARGENWPQWRGPENTGVSSEKNLAIGWSATRHIIWKLDLPGMSAATPVVWNDRIFLTSEEGADTSAEGTDIKEGGTDIVLLSINTDGRLLWKRKLGPGGKHFHQNEANQASPSPSTDGKHVYAFTGAGDFACFDFEGHEIWHFNAQERYGKFQIRHGMHVTPLLHGERLYLPLLHSGGWWVIAIDKSNGQEVWKVHRDSDAHDECEHSYASPLLGRDGDNEYLIVQGCDYTTGHRLSDGAEIWRVGDLNSKKAYDRSFRLVATPVAAADLIIVPSAKNGPVVAVKPDAKGLVQAGNSFEQWRRPHNTPDVPSPLVHDGLVYLCRETGVLICLDARTGAEQYQERLHRANYRASPVCADGKIYCTAQDGTTSVVKAGRKFELLIENTLPDEIAASPAISGGRIYLRGLNSLYAIGKSGK